MKVLDSLPLRFATLFQRSQINAEIEEELRFHTEHRAADLERSGLDPAEALRRARIEFGGHEKYKEECHEALGGDFIDSLLQDVRLAFRVLRKSPGFTFAAVLTLALAIGANAVVFGIMDGLILRPLNVPQAESLYGSEYGDGSGWQSYPNYIDLRDRNHSFDDLAAFNFAFVGLDTGKNPSLPTGFAASGNYSLRGLRQFPVDALKIDRSLVREMQADRSATDIVELIAALAHKMNLTAIAEGIESARQVERLLALGCEYGQGYYFFPADGRESGGAIHARANRPNPRQGSREVADNRKVKSKSKFKCGGESLP